MMHWQGRLAHPYALGVGEAWLDQEDVARDPAGKNVDDVRPIRLTRTRERAASNPWSSKPAPPREAQSWRPAGRSPRAMGVPGKTVWAELGLARDIHDPAIVDRFHANDRDSKPPWASGVSTGH